MAILVIYRDDVFDREVDLGEGSVRIGRGDDNEIVLADHHKSLSRHHAELRFEQGTYSVVDTNSQNGVWVEGLRVLNATLEPGVPVVVGSYKLLLKEERPPDETGDATLLSRKDADAATILSKPRAAPPPLAAKGEAPRRMPEPAAPPAAVEVPEEDPNPEPPSSSTDPALRAFMSESPRAPKPASDVRAFKPEPPPAPKRAPTPPMPEVKPEPPRPPAAAAPPAAAKPAPANPAAAAKPAVAAKFPGEARRAGKGMSNRLMFGGFAIVLMAVMAAAMFLTPLRNRLGLARNGPATSSAAAPPSVVPSAVAPTAVAPPAAPPVPSPPDPDPTAAVPPAAGSPPSRGNVKPAPGRPLTLAPAAAATPQPVVATPVAPVAPRPKPAPVPPAATTPAPAAAKEPVEKPLNLAGMFEEAQSALARGDHLAAIAGFEAILKVDPNYPSAAILLGVTRGGAKSASQLAVDSGSKAERSGDYESATKQYERALLLDPPSSAAADAMRRLKARMQIEGEDAFKRGKQYDAVGRKQDAISTYGRALQLLPPDHASAKAARARLAALKGGG